VGLADAVGQIEGINQRLRNRNRSINASAAFLEAFENDSLAIDINPARCERESLRDPATGVIQHGAQRPYGRSACVAASRKASRSAEVR
jgi:hypothetical protein